MIHTLLVLLERRHDLLFYVLRVFFHISLALITTGPFVVRSAPRFIFPLSKEPE